MLASLLATAGAGLEATLETFTARRYARVEVLTDASVQLARWLLDGVRGDVPGLMGKVAATVAQPV